MLKKIAGFSLSFILLFLGTAFFISTILSHINQKSVNSDLLINYAERFLHDNQYIYLGRELDCSGFTRNVFAQYGIKLPASSAEQFNECDKDISTTNKADLVFFKIESFEINHVGIMLNDSLFIHSPGIGKKVRTASVKDDYWLKYFYAYGRITLNK